MSIQLTKKIVKHNEKVKAWLRGAIELSREQIAEYVSPHSGERSQWFTPLETALDLCQRIQQRHFDEQHGTHLRVLEPCAGIGNLIYPMIGREKVALVGYEIDDEIAPIAAKLCAGDLMVVTQGDVFNQLASAAGFYDLVLMNAPFNIEYGQMRAREVAPKWATTSGARFLWFALTALARDGQLLALGPYNFLDRLTNDGKAWFEKNGQLAERYQAGEINGITVFGYDIRKVTVGPAVVSQVAGAAAEQQRFI